MNKSQIIKKIKELTYKGEKDGNTYRCWLSDKFNGVINYCGATDILCSHIGEDGVLTFCVTDSDDNVYYFIYGEEIPMNVLENILDYLNLGIY